MINSHKELVGEIRNFADKMELIDNFVYVKDAERIQEEVNDTDSCVMVVGLLDIAPEEEGYNMNYSYDFVISMATMYDENSVLDAETNVSFCASALSDYLNFMHDSPIELQNLNMNVESDTDSTFVSVSGRFTYPIKRSASYWKKMEDYSV